MGNGMLADVKSLQEVSLKHLHIGDVVVEFLLFNCLYLERLSIHGSYSLINLTVGRPVCALKYLEVLGCPCIKSIQISASNLVSFNYVGIKTNLLLENVPSLLDVCIGNGMVTPYFGGSMNDSFSLLSCCLKTLTLKPDIVLTTISSKQVITYMSKGQSRLLRKLGPSIARRNEFSQKLSSLVSLKEQLYHRVMEEVDAVICIRNDTKWRHFLCLEW